MTGKRAPISERLWRGVDRSDPQGCWERPGANVNRYPIIMTRVNGKSISRLASHISFELANGRPISPGLNACHTCDNPPCINPDHLFEGTHKANADDKVAKGRARGCPGARHPRARLDPDRVREIRLRLKAGETYSDLGRRFGVAAAGIRHVDLKITWKHVPE